MAGAKAAAAPAVAKITQTLSMERTFMCGKKISGRRANTDRAAAEPRLAGIKTEGDPGERSAYSHHNRELPSPVNGSRAFESPHGDGHHCRQATVTVVTVSDGHRRIITC